MGRLNDYEAAERARLGVCPDCGYYGLQWGPCGGMSQNAACPICRQRFNVPPPPFPIERYGHIQVDDFGKVIW